VPHTPKTRSRPGDFARRVARWQAAHGRHDLPWQRTRDAYRIWVSEIMLQQTQVATVIPYFERFMARFPDVAALAGATEDEVLALWSGLGYYARGRNLLRAAREVMEGHGGRFPSSFDDLAALPGIGRSTAGAIAVFAGGERRAILDGNVRRVLARHAAVGGDPARASVLADLWEVAEARLPSRELEAYTQGLMDLGATVCTAREPSCERCPVAADCIARIEDRVAQLPGKRIRPQRPTRQVAMLVVMRSGEVLLEKRPSEGIWGGLWSLPECAGDDVPGDVQPLPAFTHAFTHFTLEVTPWRASEKHLPPCASRLPPRLWLPLCDLDGAALPSPVKKLLRRLASAA
jgi:A/G-specific adenine glycosylase